MQSIEEIQDAFGYAQEIIVYNNDVKTQYKADSSVYGTVLGYWNGLLKDTHQTPAFGVSMTQHTLEALKNGLWLEFVFDKTYECGGMPFDKLLIEVNKGYYGFNIIRHSAEYNYDGRCFYIDLCGKNMDGLYDLLLSLNN